MTLLANRRGLFPAPGEKDEDYFQRVASVSSVKAVHLDLFDASPDWIEVSSGSKGLLPWEAAATWCQDGLVTIQLKKRFLFQSWYPSSEILAHELVHAMRAQFKEERFEEILAYRTSSNAFRRYFGPLFSNPRESLFFALSLSASWIGSFFSFACLCLPILVFLCFLVRLIRNQNLFTRCLQSLSHALPNPKHALAVALRLSDEEIVLFSRTPPDAISTFVASQPQLRWRLLYRAYFAEASHLQSRSETKERTEEKDSNSAGLQ